MSIVVGVDLGTTKITSLAMDADSGEVLTVGTHVNDANTTSEADRQRSRSEWNASRIVSQGLACLKLVAEQLGRKSAEVSGIGITGQQHGMLLAGKHGEAISPLINWQDRRALDLMPGSQKTWLEVTRDVRTHAIQGVTAAAGSGDSGGAGQASSATGTQTTGSKA